jgi:hypothetical protein
MEEPAPPPYRHLILKFSHRAFRVIGQLLAIYVPMCTPGPFAETRLTRTSIITVLIARSMFLPVMTVAFLTMVLEYSSREQLYYRLIDHSVIMTFENSETFVQFLKKSQTAQALICMVVALSLVIFSERSVISAASYVANTYLLTSFLLIDVFAMRDVPRRLVSIDRFIRYHGGQRASAIFLGDSVVVSDRQVLAYVATLQGRKLDFARFAREIPLIENIANDQVSPPLPESWAIVSSFYDQIDVNFSRYIKRAAACMLVFALSVEAVVVVWTQLVLPPYQNVQ